MRKIILTIIAIHFGILFAQTGPIAEIGIDEKLGNTIPLNLQFLNDKDSLVSLGSIIDRPTVFSFVYFDCPGLCSPLQEGISDVVSKSDLILGKEYKVITISFNYQDTPEKARQKKANFVTKISKESAPYWIYLTGDSASINQILHAFGFKIKQTGVDWVHPSAIMIVSPNGKITRYLYGLKFLPFDLKMAVIEAQKGLARPTVNKILEFCYSYEPEGRRYSLEITKLTGVLILFILAVFFGIMIWSKKKK